MKLSEVLKFLKLNPPLQDIDLKNVRIDSRNLQPGDLFLAIPGASADGRDYIGQALDNGAAAILAQSPFAYSQTQTAVPIFEIAELANKTSSLAAFFYNYPAQALKITAITGTNGKTSCSHYTAQLLNKLQLKCGVMGTLGNGLMPNLESATLTTSDSCSIQSVFADLKAANAKYVAMEVSSHALEQGRLGDTAIDTAVFTNLSQDHLDYHNDMESYFLAKVKLFTAYKTKNAVINLDDEYAPRLLAAIPDGTKIITYSLDNPAADISVQSNKITTPWGSGILETSLIGSFNLSNILACIACCALQGIALELILEQVKSLQAVPGRMQRVPTLSNNDPLVIIDYAHTPDALIKALQALQPYKTGILHCIFGCGGDRDRSKRPLMLEAVMQHSDRIVITQDNPRTEDPKQIVADILSRTRSQDNISIKLDRAEAIRETISSAAANDLVLIAGKGHEDYQIIGTQKLPFSDLETAQQALAARGENR